LAVETGAAGAMTAPCGRSDVGNSTAGVYEVDLMRTLILIGTALGLGAGLVCTGLFAWWLSYPVRFSVGYVGDQFASEGVTGDMDSVNPMPFLSAGLIFSAVLGAVCGLIAARRGWRLIRHTT
jgi:hypothetical protein